MRRAAIVLITILALAITGCPLPPGPGEAKILTEAFLNAMRTGDVGRALAKLPMALWTAEDMDSIRSFLNKQLELAGGVVQNGYRSFNSHSSLGKGALVTVIYDVEHERGNTNHTLTFRRLDGVLHFTHFNI